MSSNIGAAAANVDKAMSAVAQSAENMSKAGADPGALATGAVGMSQASVQAQVSVDALKIANDTTKSILDLLA
jgi:aspartate/glutamate racemase